MGLKGNNFFHHNKVGSALLSQSIAQAGTAAGITISEPWRTGRQLSFLLIGGVMGANTSLTVVVQGLRRDDGTTWEAMKESDGSTNLAFTPTDLDDATAIETAGYLLGTMDLSHADGETYKAARIFVTNNGTGGAIIFGAGYVISDLYSMSGAEGAADLFDKLHPGRP